MKYVTLKNMERATQQIAKKATIGTRQTILQSTVLLWQNLLECPLNFLSRK